MLPINPPPFLPPGGSGSGPNIISASEKHYNLRLELLPKEAIIQIEHAQNTGEKRVRRPFDFLRVIPNALFLVTGDMRQ
jgi:hypothetical protein